MSRSPITMQSHPPPSQALEPVGADFETYIEARSQGLIRRIFSVQSHLFGLLFGGLAAWLRESKRPERRRLRHLFLRLLGRLTRPFVDAQLVDEPFPVQLRRRLERLGPTYIKLGQILSLREDLLPERVTKELRNLLDRLPAVPYDRFLELVRDGLGCDPLETFSYIESQPVGSASIAQAHRAGTREGDAVILKVVKPGVRRAIERDVVLLRWLGSFLQLFLARYQPRIAIREFCDYTLRELDLAREADHAETFAANFAGEPGIVFPRIFRKYCSRDVLCMEFLRGVRPDSPKAQLLSDSDRRELIDLGMVAITRMLYRDGFFHADLHPGNLLVLPGPKCGFIDLGMVGRFDERLRRRHLFYYYCLVIGDAENAARYLTEIARPARGGDPEGFRRHVEDASRRWKLRTAHEPLALGRLILESIAQGARFRMYFPVEMVLMVKAIVTFEGVGHVLLPDSDIADLSRRHLTRLLLEQLGPAHLIREGLRMAPELVDALVQAPMLVSQGLRALESATREPSTHPFAGLRGTLIAGFSLVAGAIVLTAEGPPWASAILFGVAALLALRPGE